MGGVGNRGAGEESGRLEVDGRPMAWVRDGRPTDPLLLLAHGAGAPMTHAFMADTAAALAERGVQVIRFNFPYMQWIVDEGRRRGPDSQKRAVAAWEAVIDAFAAEGAVLGGKSFGGRMASHVAVAGDPRIRGLVYLGFPLHAPGRDGTSRADHLDGIPVPQLFVSGDRDALARIDLLRSVVARLGPRATLHVVAGGDHSLATSRAEPLRDATTWWDLVAATVRSSVP